MADNRVMVLKQNPLALMKYDNFQILDPVLDIPTLSDVNVNTIERPTIELNPVIEKKLISLLPIAEAHITSCRYCHNYTHEGRRGGHCSALSSGVQGSWKACSLAVSAFAEPEPSQDLVCVIPRILLKV